MPSYAEQPVAAGKTTGGHPARISSNLIYALVFVAALLSILWQMTTPLARFGFGKGYEAVSVARALADGQGFSNPFAALPTGPTAHLAPLFPSMLAGLLEILGDTRYFILSAAVLCALAHAIHCVLFIPLSQAFLGEARPGIFAAIFCILVPAIEILPHWEAIYAAVASQLFCLAAAKLGSTGGGWITGALCGLMLLLNPALLFVAVAWLLYSRPGWRWAAAFAMAAFLVCLPWNLRNYTQFQSVFFIRDNLGAELYVSNADCASALETVNRSSGCHASLHPNSNVAQAASVKSLGEAAFNRLRMADAGRWIRSHPGRFTHLTLLRFREFWFPSPGPNPILEYSRWAITALSAAGLTLLLYMRHRSVWLFCAALTLYPTLYYLVQASPRYRSPILWISVLPASFAAHHVLTVLGRRFHRASA